MQLHAPSPRCQQQEPSFIFFPFLTEIKIEYGNYFFRILILQSVPFALPKSTVYLPSSTVQLPAGLSWTLKSLLNDPVLCSGISPCNRSCERSRYAEFTYIFYSAFDKRHKRLKGILPVDARQLQRVPSRTPPSATRKLDAAHAPAWYSVFLSTLPVLIPCPAKRQ